MTRRIITECPACTTRFQVSDGQLKIANGKVRCGVCLEVFNAELYSVNPAVPGSTTNPAEDSATQSSIQTSDSNPPDKDPLFNQIKVPEFIPQSGIVDKRYLSSLERDETLVEQLNQATDAEPELDLDKPIQEFVAKSATVDPQQTEGTEKPASDHITDEIDLERIINEPATSTQHPELATRAEEKHDKAEKKPPTAANATTPAIKKAPPFTAVRAEPVMIRTTQQPSSQSGWWAFTCLVAALLLASQYLWFNRAALVHQPYLANLYEIVCQEIECNLPARQDIGSINTAKLVIQEHREYQGALSVNLLLENQATYTQPYPAILLSFADRKGIPISQRIFQPREYLHDSIVDQSSMPVNQSLQISLEILDPGRRAVSYQVELRPASL